MRAMVQKNHGRLAMIHGTWQPFQDHGMIMESFPWLIMFHDKHSMAFKEHGMAAVLKLFELYQQKLIFERKNEEFLFRTPWCLFTEVSPLKKRLHSTRFSLKSVLRCPAGQNYTFDEVIQMRSYQSI